MSEHRSLPELMAEIEAVKGEIADLTSADAAEKAIVPLGAAPAEVTREQMALVRAEAMKKQMRLRDLTEQVRREMERVAGETRALMEPLEAQVARMNEGLWTVNLYLGDDEEIEVLAEGAPAPADTAFTLRQGVLSMDEETAALAESGGIDAMNLPLFDEWVARPENLAQILPEPKGVVALVPRRRGRNYEDPWRNRAMAEENAWTYFLIRNGENVYRIRTDFVVGKHLVPGSREFTALFTKQVRGAGGEWENVEILPGTHAWEKASEAADAKNRHYMRVALILQGLVDRTPILHPLPTGGLNLLDQRTYDDGRAHLLMDAEAMLTDGRESFYDWLARLNSELRVGMRIIGSFNTDEFKDAGGEYYERSNYGPGHYSANDRVTPRARNQWEQDRPESNVIYYLGGRTEYQGMEAFTFKFERDERWINGELRVPKNRATCIVTATDKFVLPFDLVTVEEMRYYLRSRVNRTAYEHMFPLLKTAIAAKETEAAEEAPFRDLLAAELTKVDSDLDPADMAAARAVLDPLVDWWKIGNKHHRALVGEPDAEKRAIKAIIAEHLARKGDLAVADADAEAAVVKRLRDQDPSIMFVARKRDGGYLAFAPQPRRYDSRVAAADLWVVEYTTTKTARTIKKREWLTVTARPAGLRVLFEATAWKSWDKTGSPNSDLTDDEIDEILAELVPGVVDRVRDGWVTNSWAGVEASAPVDVTMLGVTHAPDQRGFKVWMTEAFMPETLSRAPRADSGADDVPHYRDYIVKAQWSKKGRGGVTLSQPLLEKQDGDRWYSRGGSAAEPWRHVWEGKERGPGVISTNAAGQAHTTARAEAIEQFKAARKALQEPSDVSLRHVQKGIRAAKEQIAYEQFVAEYLDPDLWDGHVKILRSKTYGDPFEPNFAGGRHYRGVPVTLTKALDVLTDAGVSHEGLTVRTAVVKAGLDPATVESEFEEKFAKEPIDSTLFMDLALRPTSEG